MTQQEFIQRTGYCPTDKQFDVINSMYMASDDDKDSFCRKWKKTQIAECSKASAMHINELESKLKNVKQLLDDYIFRHLDKIDALDDKFDRRCYLDNLYRDLKKIF